VPFLGEIPVIGSLFSRTGDFTMKRKLMILLKASILNPDEYEPKTGASR
jgi:type II secretory pathway component GspD/PulD (secretin)